MEFNQSRITLARAMLTPILDWIITEGRPDCKVVRVERVGVKILQATKQRGE
jgi:hypothetical protein